MTAILGVWTPDVQCIATDSQVTSDQIMASSTKIVRPWDGMAIATSGAPAFRAWSVSDAAWDVEIEEEHGQEAALFAYLTAWRAWKKDNAPDVDVWGVAVGTDGIWCIDVSGVPFALSTSSGLAVTGSGSGGAAARVAFELLLDVCPDMDIGGATARAVQATCGIIDGCSGTVHLVTL